MSTLRGSNCGLVQCGCPAHTHTPTYPWPCRWESLIEGKHQLLDQRLLWRCIMNRIQHTVMNLLHLLLLLLLLLCLPRHFLLYSKTDRETDRETDLSVKKKKTKANPRTIRTRLCLSLKQYIPQRKTKPNKNIISGRKMLERRQNQDEQEHVCQTENVCKKKKNHPEREGICPKKQCLQEEERQNQQEEDVFRKMFFVRRKTKPRRRRCLPKNVFCKKKDKKTNDKKQSTSLQRVGTIQWSSTCTQQIQNWWRPIPW